MSKVVALLFAGLALGLAAPAAAGQGSSVGAGELTIRYQPEEEVTVVDVIDELAPETVLTVRAFGFAPDTTGTVTQCVATDVRGCRNSLPVRYDSAGSATFQYLISNEIDDEASAGEGCRVGGNRCTIELRSGAKRSVVETVFVDAVPPLGQIALEPASDLVEGETVELTLTGFPAEAELTALVCAKPATSGSRCGAPGLDVPLTIGNDGSATAAVVLEVTEVGSDGVACDRRTACQVVVSSDEVGVRAMPVRIDFAEGTGAEYVTSQVAVGVGLALGFLVLAWWLVRRTNWDPPAEADSTAIDEAEFADLDLEAELFEERESVGAP